MSGTRTSNEEKQDAASTKVVKPGDSRALNDFLYNQLKLNEYLAKKDVDKSWDDIIPKLERFLEQKKYNCQRGDSSSLGYCDACEADLTKQINSLRDKQSGKPVVDFTTVLPESKEAPEMPSQSQPAVLMLKDTLTPMKQHLDVIEQKLASNTIFVEDAWKAVKKAKRALKAELILKYIQNPMKRVLDMIVKHIAPKELPAAFNELLLSAGIKWSSNENSPEEVLKKAQQDIYKAMAKTPEQASRERLKKAFWFGLKVICTFGLYLCWNSWWQEKPYNIEQWTTSKYSWDKLKEFRTKDRGADSTSIIFNKVGELRKVVVEDPGNQQVTIYGSTNQVERLKVLHRACQQHEYVGDKTVEQLLKQAQIVACSDIATQASKDESRSIIESARPRLA